MFSWAHLRYCALSLMLVFSCCMIYGQQAGKITITYNDKISFQSISNFAASDAWACQFVGNWPEEKKKVIADWLFSRDTLTDGSPRGIGLSMWRYNLGAGSAEQKEGSGIRDDWRRAALSADTGNERVRGQNWFLKAAKERGVQQFLGFFNSPPVQFTINGKAYASGGKCNIDSTRFQDFADYIVEAIDQIDRSSGVSLNYISPVNEPQWDWSDGGQEGCPYTNYQINSLVHVLSKTFLQNKLHVKIVVSESGHLKYLLKEDDKPGRASQVYAFFNPASPDYIGNLPNVNKTIAAHSYFTTSPLNEAIQIRTELREAVAKVRGLSYWQSEYCILGDNHGEINGSKKDLGMDPALYLARVVHEDLVEANATSWQWWTAISAYDYKDGLIYVDKNERDGSFTYSKMLWALGNYSYFIRPGMKRIQASASDKDLFVSAFQDRRKIVIEVINPTVNNKSVVLLPANKNHKRKRVISTYTTNASGNLKKSGLSSNVVMLPEKSVVTIVVD